MRRTIFASAFLVCSLLAAPAAAWTIFFEAIPVAGYSLPGLSGAPYSERLALTRAAADGVVPQVAASLGLAGKMSPVAIGPCGTRMATQPAMRADVASDRNAALNLAAALGYVFRQSAVLVADFDDAAGADTAYGIVGMPPGAVDPSLAHRFYLHALAADRQLSGYATMPEGLIFFAWGRVEAPDFLPSLRRAAESFGEPEVRFARAGKAKVILATNNWDADSEGSAYRQRFQPSFVALLDQAAQRNQALIERLVDRFRWRPPPTPRDAEPQATSAGP